LGKGNETVKKSIKNVPGGPVPDHLGGYLKLHLEHNLRVIALAL